MCGIGGLVNARSDRPVDRARLERMNDALRHRGPDDAGIWVSTDGRVGLAHRRLSIIDLSERGRQPMTDSGGRLWITLNGEIYNYRDLRKELETLGHPFRSESDTEVVLEAYRAWGTQCLARLNGMFAFALYDGDMRRLFIARDRAGEKPFFYRLHDGSFAFASELKALMVDPSFPRILNIEGLEHYLAYGYVPGEMCILDGVRKLPQGHAALYNVETGNLRIWRYWQLPEQPPNGLASDEELTDELDRLLESAVRRQLEADVPVGILLSGGMDSSLVTAIASRVSPDPVKTFTIIFPGHRKFDEGPHARMVAAHFGTRHTELAADPSDVDLLPELARQFDEPIADSAIVPTYLVSKMIRRHATVALSGDGGDELFAGYPHYSWIQREERIRRFVPGLISNGIGMLGCRLPIGFRGRNHAIGFAGDLPWSIAHINMYFDRAQRHRLLLPAFRNRPNFGGSPEGYRSGLCGASHTPLRQATEADFRSTLVDAYLVKVDRASMLTSLEVRAPFLDREVIEFAFGHVTDALRANATERKILLRRLARRLLPPGFDFNRKQGFTMPLAAWFRGEWGEYAESVLHDADPRLFDRRALGELIALQKKGYANTQRLFALTMFELWRREYRVDIPG
jgi:asparagine synthase (glutamine-hydrolysing)